jgi:ribosomal protein S18 acetylase RimI-like enzyme
VPQGTICVVEIRRVGVADWETVREVRLRALSDAPEAFGSSYDREVAFADDVWIGRLATATNATLLCETEADRCGIVTLVRDEKDRRTGFVVGMWVSPSSRGTGAADLLVEAALRWAREQGISTVRLHVAEGNVRAEHLYRRHGFNRTCERFTGERRGLVEIEMQRQLFSDAQP